MLLGRLLKATVVSPDSKKTLAVANIPTQKSREQVSGYFGIGSYYRRFVFNFPKITASLIQPAKDDESFTWNSNQHTALEGLRYLLVATLVLRHFDEDAETAILTHENNQGIGADLVQIQGRVEVEHNQKPWSTLLRPKKNAWLSCANNQFEGLPLRKNI